MKNSVLKKFISIAAGTDSMRESANRKRQPERGGSEGGTDSRRRYSIPYSG